MDDLDPSDGEGDAKLAASARVGPLIDTQRRHRSPPNLDSESEDGAKPLVKEEAKPASPAPDRGPAASLAAGLPMRSNPARMGGAKRRRAGSSSSTAMGREGRRACVPPAALSDSPTTLSDGTDTKQTKTQQPHQQQQQQRQHNNTVAILAQVLARGSSLDERPRAAKDVR